MELQIRHHRPLTFTKAEAAGRHVEGAVEALVRGHFDIAITLAGAAEGMLDGSKLFDYQRNHPRAEQLGIQKKDLADHMNAERNWLKHPGSPESMEFTLYSAALYSAAFMIARAVTALEPEHCSTPIKAFSIWWHDYVEALN